MGDEMDPPPVFATTLQEPRLPSYSSTSGPTSLVPRVEHAYSLNSSSGKPWLSLRLKSYASSPQALPMFHQDDLGIIEGEVSIDISEIGKVKSVTVILCGERTVVGQDKSPNFLALRSELWNSNSKMSSGPWNFKLKLPNEITLKEYGVTREQYSLPPSFSIKTVPSFLEYRFRLNSQLDTTVIYIPKGLSPTLPPAHLTSLAQNEPLPIPSSSDWSIGKPLSIHGTIFGTRPITINASIAVLPGSTLAIGTFSPALIILECADEQALDLFSNPSTIRFRLVQKVYIGTDSDRHSSHNTFTTSLGRARVWPTSHPLEVLPPNRRLVEAELVIPRITRPSFEFARFEVKYQIQLSFDAPGFTWDEAVSLPSGVTKPSLEMDVILVSDSGSKIVWRSRVPAVYARQDLKDEDFYDDQNITGVLLGAGQKFIGHHHGG